MQYRIRPVESLPELVRVFGAAAAWLPEPMTHTDRRFGDLEQRFGPDRSLMLRADADAGLAGAALGFRSGTGPAAGTSVLVRLLAVAPAYRGQGLGRALLEELERVATASGAVTVHLGAVPEARGFYARVGYSGRSRMVKSLPGAALLADPDRRRSRLAQLRARRAARDPSRAEGPEADRGRSDG